MVGETAPASQASLAVHQRVEQLLQAIQPNRQSEFRRLTIANYVINLIKNALAAFHAGQVEAFMFGSVPLRTYLPDGDIDISVFSSPNSRDASSVLSLKDTWANQLLKALEAEQARSDAPFKIRDLQIIQAEVKLVKCVVADVVVDVSFETLGGLCTVAFLESIDRKIGRGHLFKRSIVLVKAWCYYESRLLGAHHGLISSYALEAMVLYVFNLHHKELDSPMQVLCKFLDVFSSFNWDEYCLSLQGPIPLNTFPSPKVDTHGLDPESLLLDPAFLEDVLSKYSVQPQAGAPPHPAHFVLKHLNIVDPLLPSNNLGRSVSKASFARIRRAFAHGANAISNIMKKEPRDAIEGIDLFFKNTWRSPLRMAADNHAFMQRLGLGNMPYPIPLAPAYSAPRSSDPLAGLPQPPPPPASQPPAAPQPAAQQPPVQALPQQAQHESPIPLPQPNYAQMLTEVMRRQQQQRAQQLQQQQLQGTQIMAGGNAGGATAARCSLEALAQSLQLLQLQQSEQVLPGVAAPITRPPTAPPLLLQQQLAPKEGARLIERRHSFGSLAQLGGSSSDASVGSRSGAPAAAATVADIAASLQRQQAAAAAVAAGVPQPGRHLAAGATGAALQPAEVAPGGEQAGRDVLQQASTSAEAVAAAAVAAAATAAAAAAAGEAQPAPTAADKPPAAHGQGAARAGEAAVPSSTGGSSSTNSGHPAAELREGKAQAERTMPPSTSLLLGARAHSLPLPGTMPLRGALPSVGPLRPAVRQQGPGGHGGAMLSDEALAALLAGNHMHAMTAPNTPTTPAAMAAAAAVSAAAQAQHAAQQPRQPAVVPAASNGAAASPHSSVLSQLSLLTPYQLQLLATQPQLLQTLLASQTDRGRAGTPVWVAVPPPGPVARAGDSQPAAEAVRAAPPSPQQQQQQQQQPSARPLPLQPPPPLQAPPQPPQQACTGLSPSGPEEAAAAQPTDIFTGDLQSLSQNLNTARSCQQHEKEPHVAGTSGSRSSQHGEGGGGSGGPQRGESSPHSTGSNIGSPPRVSGVPPPPPPPSGLPPSPPLTASPGDKVQAAMATLPQLRTSSSNGITAGGADSEVCSHASTPKPSLQRQRPEGASPARSVASSGAASSPTSRGAWTPPAGRRSWSEIASSAKQAAGGSGASRAQQGQQAQGQGQGGQPRGSSEFPRAVQRLAGSGSVRGGSTAGSKASSASGTPTSTSEAANGPAPSQRRQGARPSKQPSALSLADEGEFPSLGGSAAPTASPAAAPAGPWRAAKREQPDA